jgi:phosphohistidine phosphatase SixA
MSGLHCRQPDQPGSNISLSEGVTSITRFAGCARIRFAMLCIYLLSGCGSMAVADPAAGLWSRLAQGGYVLVIAHAEGANTASGRAYLAQDGCATREHLSADGRQALGNLKDTLLSRKITVGRVLTSHDCRCVETAGLLFERAQPWSIIDTPDQLDAQLRGQTRAALIEAVSRWDSDANLALVTHRVVIRDSFDIEATPAQLLVIEPLGGQGFRIVGSLSPGTDF